MKPLVGYIADRDRKQYLLHREQALRKRNKRKMVAKHAKKVTRVQGIVVHSVRRCKTLLGSDLSRFVV